jgi:glutamine---fructose-6-phosphate transaminase (isomerizing)
VSAGATGGGGGRAALLRDMAAQAGAIRALARQETLAHDVAELAEAVGEEGPVLLSGMGASLYAAEVVAAAWRGDGVQAWTLPASELAHHVPRTWGGPLVLVSQSGASAEVVRVAQTLPRRVAPWCLTLNPSFDLAGVRPIVLPGDLERGYAATRSFTTTLAALAMVRAATLGARIDLDAAAAAIDMAIPAAREPMAAAAADVAGCESFVVTARGPLKGLAAYGALIAMELAALPASSLDAGLLRHGPVEALGPRYGVVALRAADAVAPLIGAIVGLAARHGSPSVLLEEAGIGDRPGARHRHRVAAGDAVGGWLALAVTLQSLAVALAEARGRVPGEGTRGSKVTVEE